MKIEVVQGDITSLEVECIVNAANPALAHGAGVCGAIFQAAGIDKLEEYIYKNHWRGCQTGHCVITPSFDMAPKINHIIHVVGPIYHHYEKDQAEKLLKLAYGHTMEKAMEHGVKSIAFPLISGGVYGYPLREAITVAVKSVKLYKAVYALMEDKTTFPDVTFCAFNGEVYDMYNEVINELI
jgi:O-acetyl-ADP-ribose deacetylase (regulator of RNase III)